ncbi:unnamed protein product [Pleuronectes platessa]|uniref:Uncharacterized protein n=1 Tax=Pleuronectes platessa TaxID=8262 RepID=A0A9N7YX25_PLEPL|nr:unnamed protein product [Pleuronectes platessa]
MRLIPELEFHELMGRTPAGASSLTAELTRSQEELETERSLRNQEKLELQESLRAATQAVDEEKEARKKPKKKSVFKRFR